MAPVNRSRSRSPNLKTDFRNNDYYHKDNAMANPYDKKDHRDRPHSSDNKTERESRRDGHSRKRNRSKSRER